ncbi:unnamed protein product [Acanthoscelides obtectus]|uniref:Uncharacterized protein n=1 Tax=Acanthoscelides obtectus TaxID=200917 RepID=A0A9P0KKP7_ACAOB|nr:unnamed protein product [Acanthoscelides obtectus]CAK1665134.1 hypothetical protein AOBTE_LOCUS24674 [Acanthoscelides obtectus]
MQLNQQSATEESDRLYNQASDNSDNTGECSTIVIKQEPPCDMDIEIWFPEPKVEPSSDSETESADSPPQLDRMDIATSSSYVLSVQKRALGACGTDHTRGFQM